MPDSVGVDRGPFAVSHPDRAPTLSAARARVLAHLRDHPDAVAVEELAREFDQHPNTVRNHVDALVRDGLVLRERVPGPERGRPPWRYRIDPQRVEPDPRLREHQGLVTALAVHLAERSPDPRAEARSAGQGWGRALVAGRGRTAPTGEYPHPTSGTSQTPRPTSAAQRQQVVQLLADLDFSPRSDPAATRVVLTTCPLLDVARRNPEVVCAVHEGMVAGALAALRGSDPGGEDPAHADDGASTDAGAHAGGASADDGVRLAPFASPQGCVLSLPRARAGVSGPDESPASRAQRP